MKKVAALALALVLGLSMAAWAGEVSGKIQAVDSAERVITLEDGTKLWLAEGISLDNLKEGAKVKASYEERDGKNVVTSIDVEEGRRPRAPNARGLSVPTPRPIPETAG